MKTAEEWQNETKVGNTASVDWIKQIQLDSFKAGMTKAANIVMDKNDRHSLVSPRDAFYEILDDRDAMKELP